MLTWYRSLNRSQTALLPLGRPNQVLSAVPGHLLFPLETPQPCWRAVGRSRSVSSASPLPPVHLASRVAVAQWVLLGGGCCSHPRIYAQTYPSLPLELPFPSGWCRWSPNPPRRRGFISGFTSTIGIKERRKSPSSQERFFLLHTCREKPWSGFNDGQSDLRGCACRVGKEPWCRCAPVALQCRITEQCDLSIHYLSLRFVWTCRMSIGCRSRGCFGKVQGDLCTGGEGAV